MTNSLQYVTMTEADYVCFLAKSISLGLYQKGGFVVLSRLVVDPKSVHFPDLGYSVEFWNIIKKCKAKNLGDVFPKSVVQEVASKLPHNDVSKIDILKTEYGTVGSYFVKNGKIIMTQRAGSSKEEFERTFLLAKVKIKNKDDAEIGTINWHKRQAVVDYTYGRQKSRLTNDLIQESNDYLKKLGFPQDASFDKIDFKNFTKQEENLFKYMISAKGEIVSFDKTAQILWGENSYDKYSPAAMAKVIENIRTKIKDQGINKELIFTKRGKGYLLN